MSLDLTKPVQTRNGQKVRILCTDAECANNDVPQPIVGLVAGEFSGPKAWCADGSYFGDRSFSRLDLINVPPQKKKVTVFIELRRGHDGSLYAASRPHKAPEASFNTIAATTIEMEYEEQP